MREKIENDKLVELMFRVPRLVRRPMVCIDNEVQYIIRPFHLLIYFS